MPQIKITDLIDNAVENALARREQALTTEETNQIKGGLQLIGRVGPGFPFGKLVDPLLQRRIININNREIIINR